MEKGDEGKKDKKLVQFALRWRFFRSYELDLTAL